MTCWISSALQQPCHFTLCFKPNRNCYQYSITNRLNNPCIIPPQRLRLYSIAELPPNAKDEVCLGETFSSPSDDWKSASTPGGRVYYYNKLTSAASWGRPITQAGSCLNSSPDESLLSETPPCVDAQVFSFLCILT